MATDTTALALLSKPPAKLSKAPQRRDKDFWLMRKRGWTDEQLAVRFNCKPETVKACVDRYELWRANFANDEVDLEVNQMLMRVLPKAEKVLKDGMAATKVEINTRGKKVISKRVADHHVRFKAVEMAQSFMEATKPKGIGVQVNTQVNNPGGQQGGPQAPQGFDFESRVRQLREKRGLSNNDDFVDGEYEDVVPSTVAEELADIGIDLDDDEDEEDGEE